MPLRGHQHMKAHDLIAVVESTETVIMDTWDEGI